MPRPGARVTSATLNGGGIDLSLGTGNFVVDNVTVGSCGGWAGVEDCDTAIGHNLTINNLTGPLEYHLNTDLANNQADTVTINNAVGAMASKLQVNYDPVYPTGKSATGAKVVATVLRGNAGFALMNRQYDEYVYAPTISPSKPGATVWTLTKLAPVPGESEESSRGGITRPCSEGSMLRRRSNDSK